eukprot:GFYU01006109.1.p1 GENE.GFYU01006109.1~~GFYU01006109.1.p1  ORF type:complete len:272 (-),score=58.22 GFYU01006109.1:164-979(-)
MYERAADMEEEMTENEDVRHELFKRVMMIAKFMIQAGQTRKAMERLEENRELATELYGKDSLECAEVLFQLGDAKMKRGRELHSFVNPQLTASYKHVRELFVEALQIREDRGDTVVNRAKGHMLCAEACMGYYNCRPGDVEVADAGHKHLDTAQELLQECGDPQKLNSYTRMCRALMYKTGNRASKGWEEIQLAEEECRREIGECMLLCRIKYNEMIILERLGQWTKAYLSVRESWLLSTKLFGSDHAQTKLARKVLDEPSYRMIAAENGH